MSAFNEAVALARERELDDTRHFVPVVDPTQHKYEKMARKWEEYLGQFGITPDNCLQPGEEMPSRGRLKAFMEWIVKTSEGMFEQDIVETTLRNKWYCFRSMYQRKTYNVIGDEFGKDVLSFIKSLYKRIVRRCRKKQIADSLDIQWVLTYLWCYDSYEFLHPRCRIQFHLIALILVYTGARPGTIIESSAYRGTNEALKYKDFEMIGLPTDNGGIELQLKVRLCFEKGRRETRNDQLDDSQDQENVYEHKWITLREDRGCRGRCPITLFLCLGLADDVFEALSQPHDVMCLRAPPGGNCLSFHMKSLVKDTPIFRMIDRNGRVSGTRALTHGCFHRDLAGAGQRFGFKDRLKPYDIRRGTANDVNGSSEVSATQYSQLLGHSVKVLGESYVSNISGIDAQNLVNGKELRKDHIRLLRSKRLHLNLKVPMELPYHKNLEVLEDAKLQELQAKEDNLLANLIEQFRPFKTSIGSELNREYQKVMGTRKHCYRRLYDCAYRKFRQEYFHDAGSNEIRRQILQGPAPEPTNDYALEDSELSSLLTFVSSTYFPERSFVAHLLFNDCSKTQNGLPEHALLEQMKAMCISDPYILYYPRETPVDGHCPSCQRLLIDLVPKIYQQAEHIHQCIKQKHQGLCNIAFQQHLPPCCLWARCKSNLVRKQKYLLDSFGEEYSDPKERQLARNIEAKRLHDTRRRDTTSTIISSVTPSSPSKMAERAKYIQQHLQNHVRHQVKCCWDGCNAYCGSEFELKRHLRNMHQVMVRRSPVEPFFCFEHPEMGWFECEFEWEDHCKTHLTTVTKSCNLSRRYHTMIRALQCPFCLGNSKLSATDKTRQFTLRSIFNRHMDSHFTQILRTEGFISCPHPLCGPESTFPVIQDLKIHFYDTHKLPEKGFVRSRSKLVNKSHRAKKFCHDEVSLSARWEEAACAPDVDIVDSAYGTDDHSDADIGFDGMSDDLSICESSSSVEEWEGFSDSNEGNDDDRDAVNSDVEDESSTIGKTDNFKGELSLTRSYGENIVPKERWKHLCEMHRGHPRKRKLRPNR